MPARRTPDDARLYAAQAARTGVASLLFLTTGNATVQLAADPGYRGRVMALWSTALVGSTPIGSPVIGALSDGFSPRSAILLGAVACAAAAAIGRWPARSPKTPKTPKTPKPPKTPKTAKS